MVLLLIIYISCLITSKKDNNNVNKVIDKIIDNNNVQKKYKLAIMAIFKNEEKYMEEWINHHIKEGVEHFYLYSNDPNLNKYTFIDKYKFYVTVILWTNETNDIIGTIQRKAYKDCVEKYGKDCQFLMMLDIDEFIISISENERVIDIINRLDINNTKAIKVQRYNFGSNGHIKKPEGNVYDNYKKHEMICSTYKTIANTDYVDKNKNFFGVHDFPFINKQGKVYNEYFDYKYTGFPNGCTRETKNEIPLVINHYFTKSYEEYLDRCKLWQYGGVNNIGYRKNCENNFKENDKNEVESYIFQSM